MITKISIINERGKSFDKNDVLKNAAINFSREAAFFDMASKLMMYLHEFPYCDLERTIETHFGQNYSITQKTKKCRTYHIHGGLYIHEED